MTATSIGDPNGGRCGAALDLIRAGDLIRTLAKAGRPPTSNDLHRAESARARFDGRTPRQLHGRRV